MKKSLILCIFLIAGIAGLQAQQSEVRNAYGFLSTGQLANAKKAIDNASNHPRVGTRPRTLLYRSFIYSGLALDTNNKAAMFGELQTALDAIKKISGDNRSATIGQEDIDDAYNRIYTAAYNRGVIAVRGNNLRDALRYFEIASQVNAEDTSLILSQAVLAQKLFDKEKAIQMYEKLLGMNYREESIYRNLSRLYEESGKEAEALRVIQDGRSVYPDSEALAFDELNFYLKRGQPVEAIDMIESAVKFEPDNPTVWYSLGVAYYKSGATSEAERAFAKATELKPDYYEAYYNLGLIYYNSASKIIARANQRSRFIGASAYNEYKRDYLEELKVAKNYFEKAYALNSKDVSLLMPLREVYERTGDIDRAERIRAEIYLMN